MFDNDGALGPVVLEAPPSSQTEFLVVPTHPPTTWQTARFTIDLARPQVMGIVNVTTDSFSDGGLHATAAAACAHCERLVAEGADILDIGGESTRPGSTPPSLELELEQIGRAHV